MVPKHVLSFACHLFLLPTTQPSPQEAKSTFNDPFSNIYSQIFQLLLCITVPVIRHWTHQKKEWLLLILSTSPSSSSLTTTNSWWTLVMETWSPIHHHPSQGLIWIYIYSNAVYELFNLIQILDRISKLSPFVNLNICTCRNQFCRSVSSQTVCNEHQLWAILLLGWIIHSFFHSLTNWKGYLCFFRVKT